MLPPCNTVESSVVPNRKPLFSIVAPTMKIC
jgi:hypothetical protein